MGTPWYDTVHRIDNKQKLYKYALGIIRRIPSVATLPEDRGHLQSLYSVSLPLPKIRNATQELDYPSMLSNVFVPIAVTPFNNLKIKKEDVSYNLQGVQ